MMEAIRQKVLEYCTAVEKQDRTAFRQLFDQDATLISISTLFDGIDSIANDFLGVIQKAYQTIRLIPENIDIRFWNDNMAVVIFQYHTECIRREDGSEYGIAGMETQIYMHKNGDWRLTHVHYSKK